MKFSFLFLVINYFKTYNGTDAKISIIKTIEDVNQVTCYRRVGNVMFTMYWTSRVVSRASNVVLSIWIRSIIIISYPTIMMPIIVITMRCSIPLLKTYQMVAYLNLRKIHNLQGFLGGAKSLRGEQYCLPLFLSFFI